MLIALLSVGFPVLIASLVAALAIYQQRLTPLALVLALVPPLAILLYIIALTAPDGRVAYIDLIMNYQGAVALYNHGITPYSTFGASSFPFPTFYLYYLASAGGTQGITFTWIVWCIVGLFLWAACAASIVRLAPAPYRREVVLLCVIAPALMTLNNGQTSLFVLAGLTLLYHALNTEKQWAWAVGGAGLALAVLIKPQLAAIGIGLALWWWLTRRDGNKVALLLSATYITAAGAILATILLHNGVQIEHYIQFVREVMPSLNHQDYVNVFNGSPAYFARAITGSDIAADAVTGAILFAALVWVYRQQQRGAAYIAAGLSVWAILLTQIAWGIYAVWTLPYFAVEMVDALKQGRRARAAWILVILGMLSWQPPYLAVNAAQMLALLALVWTTPTVTLAPQRRLQVIRG